MGMYCVAPGCKTEKKKGVTTRFFRVPPKDTEKGRQWRAALSRAGWSPTKAYDARICAHHFISGEASDDHTNPDYVPSKFSFKKSKQNEEQTLERHSRFVKRQKLFFEDPEVPEAQCSMSMKEIIDNSEWSDAQEGVTPVVNPCISTCDNCEKLTQHVTELQSSLESAQQEISALKKKISVLEPRVLSVESLDDKPSIVKLYTGLANLNVMMWLLSMVMDCTSFVAPNCKGLSAKSQLLMVLTKIKLGLLHADLALRFGTTRSVVSRVFRAWVPALSAVCRSLVYWPDPDTRLLNMPKPFVNSFANVCSTIDCFEIFIERPTLLRSRAQTWSSYKHHQTLKFLISITPNCLINFISEGWGGRTSDKHLTLHCGYLDFPEPGSTVLADRGFLIRDELAMRGVKLVMPAFTKGRNQLSKREVDESRLCAKLRIHVERVIRKVKQFRLFQGVIPIKLVEHVDDCAMIVAGIVNLDYGAVQQIEPE